MVKLNYTDKRVLEDALNMSSGYVLDFSDRTMAEFFGGEFGIEIYQEKYRFNGTSKAKHMRAFVEVEDAYTVARVLRRLWEHRESYDAEAAKGPLKQRVLDMIARIEGEGGTPRTDAIERFTRDPTLEELVASIERDIGANKPGPALDRLHTYCMKKLRHLLGQRPSVTVDKDEPLHSLAGKYVKALSQERALQDVTLQIVRSSISVFEKFNHVRNNQSLAHDNELVDPAEARFIFDSISAFLRFTKSIETRFDA